MTGLIMLLFAASLLFTSCTKKEMNPRLIKWEPPFQTPPFNKIKTTDYLHVFKGAIKIHNNEMSPF